jgi:hypothetical protein
MKFLYSDTQDYVDPNFDFLADASLSTRERYWQDKYAHEVMDRAPYDGLLVAMSAVRKAKGVAASKVRYTTAEEQRLLRDGARRFLRFDGPKHRNLMLMGDCGAFAYVDHPEPAYSVTEVIEFYLDAEFTHGVSPDHVILEFDPKNPPAKAISEEIRNRYDITLSNAENFLKLVRAEGTPFEPLGAVQGWSPQSMAEAAASLIAMGYRYVAIGGLVPLRVEAIRLVLETIREKVGNDPWIHLLGFAKADHIDQFIKYGVTSFDSTSPLIRAFKDAKSNYYVDDGSGQLKYYTAIRIPQALENPRLMQGVKRGLFEPDDLQAREASALNALRKFDQGLKPIDAALDAVMDYSRFLILGDGQTALAQEKALESSRARVTRTLQDRPWKNCPCAVCRTVGVEVIIFRGSNRNKRRGFHNLSVYHNHLHRTLGINV